jgi:hypothetical protein
MVDVKMPDGAVVRFPDDMPADQIKAMIQQKFPDAGKNAAPAPEPTWRDPGVLVPIQFNTEGGARLAMPQIATDAWNAIQAPGKALAGEYDEREVDPITGELSPFDPRMVQDAANLASMGSPVTPAARLGAPALGAARSIARAATPEIDDLYAAKDAAYKTVDQLGARYAPDAVDNLSVDMLRRASEANISPERHPKAYSMLVDWEKRGGQGMSLTELDQMRQVIRRDLIAGGDAAEGHFGNLFIKAIDDFIDTATPAKISGVTGQTADFAIRTARKANTVLRKSERLQDALEAARLRAAASGSGGNVDNAIRQELVRIVKDPKTFSADEIAQMERIIMGGGRTQDMLRKLGKLSPSGNGLMAALGVGATMANPANAIIPAVGLAAKTISDRATQAGVQNLTKVVRGGANSAPPLPRPAGPLIPNANTTLIQQNFAPKVPAPLPTFSELMRQGA